MQGYAMIPLVAFFLNVFLLLIFASAKKTEIIRTFMILQVLACVWTLGSFLMRIEFMGLTPIWYHFSLFGIWVGALWIDVLICRFAGVKLSTPEKVVFAIVAAMLLANVFTGMFLAPPEVVPLGDGDVRFVYSMTIGTYVMYGILALVFTFIGAHVLTCVRRRNLTKDQVTPLVIGFICTVLGNTLIMFPPLSGIPLDIVSSAIFSICIFVALYYRHLFPLTLAFSRRTYAFATAVSLLVFVSFLTPALESWAKTLPAPLCDSATTIVALAAVVWVVVVYRVVYRISENLFLREHNSRLSGIQDYHAEISRSLDIYQIADKFCAQVLKGLHGVRAVRMCAVNSEGDLIIVGSSSGFEIGKCAISANSVILQWLSDQKDPVFLSEFSRSTEYRGMWESEKQQLNALGCDCVAPLLDDGELLGVAFLTFANHEQKLSISDMEFLVNLLMLTASSARNSVLYARVMLDAQTDDLTGLLNRKYFLESVEQYAAANPSEVCSLVIVNVDDFKLYNQLYGEKEGDRALTRIAEIIKHSVPESYQTARYGGKEFAIFMPGKDPRTAMRLAENLHKQIYDLNKTPTYELGALKIITTSIGICSIPFGASNAKQLLENTDMAVFQVKQHGKNGIKTFSVSKMHSGDEPEPINKHEAYSSYESTIFALAAAIDAKDHYTFTHSNHVAYYAQKLAQAYGLDSDTVEMIREAGLLHDIGKIGIPENILNKNGRLTTDEFEIMKRHPENAVSIIRHLPSLDYVIPAVIGHHERWDGRGYPRQLKGEDIPLAARILCVADCFDAITTKRCYQDPRSVDAALDILMEGKGTQFDPSLAELFVQEVKADRIKVQTGPAVTE